MPLGVDCPACRHQFMVPDKMGGRGVKCPRCEHSFIASNGALAPTPPTDLPLAPVVAPGSPPPSALPLPAAPLVPPAAPVPLPTAQAIAAQWRAPQNRPAPPRRGLTRLVLDLPETVLKSVPRPLQGITGLATIGLVGGLVAWAFTGWLRLDAVALGLALLGLLFGGVAAAALLKRGERGLGLPLAAVLVNAQALVFAAAAALAEPPADPEAPAVKGAAGNKAVTALRDRLKHADPRERFQAAFGIGEIARDLTRAVPDLMALLRDPDRSVRGAAADNLATFGPQARLAYPALAEATRADPDETVRLKARDAARKIGAPTEADVGLLLEALTDRKSAKQLRAAAAQAIGQVGGEARAAVRQLEEALKDPEPSVRVSAAEALWALKAKPADELLETFIAGLKDFDPYVRYLAARGLTAMRREARDAAPALEVALSDEDATVRWRAAGALWGIGPPAKAQVPRLITTMKEDKDARTRLTAAYAVWEISRQKDGVPVLSAALKHQELTIRQTAVLFLKQMCNDAKNERLPFADKPGKIALADAVPALIAALEDKDAEVRGSAAVTLGIIGPDARAAVPGLTQALKTGDPEFKAEAAFALGHIGPAAKAAAPALADALKDRDATVRRFAAEALYQVDPQRVAEVVDTLIGVLADRSANNRVYAAKDLGGMREKARPAVPALNDALKDSHKAVRIAAAGALAKIGGPARVTFPTLDQLAKDDEPEVRKAAVDAKKAVGAPQKADVLLLLIPALKHDNARYREAAVVCLWMLGRDAREAVKPLSEALLNDGDVGVRRTAAFALAAIGKDAADAVPALIKALQSRGDDELRANAAYALGEIGAPAKKAVEPLRTALEDKKPTVRLHAAQALWALEGKAQDVVPALTRLLDEKDVDGLLVAAAIETLAKIGTTAGDEKLTQLLRTKVVPALARLAAEGDETVQFAAVQALGSIGAEGRGGVPRLLDTLSEADAQLRLAAIEALVKIAAAEKDAKLSVRARVAFAALAFLSKVDASPQVQRAASLAMTKIGEPAAADVPDLLEIIGDREQPLAFRAAAAQVLALVGPDAKAHVGPMAKLLKAEEPGLRVLVAYALGALGAEGKDAIGPLTEALKDDEVLVRVAIVQALGDLGQFFAAQAEPPLRRLFLSADEPNEVREAAAESLKRLGPIKK
jgi:predicted Zn finger-like uncharacterized protein